MSLTLDAVEDNAQSGKPLKHIRRFGCTTRELCELVVRLQEFGDSKAGEQCSSYSFGWRHRI
jgi:hypothetical protein